MESNPFDSKAIAYKFISFWVRAAVIAAMRGFLCLQPVGRREAVLSSEELRLTIVDVMRNFCDEI